MGYSGPDGYLRIRRGLDKLLLFELRPSIPCTVRFRSLDGTRIDLLPCRCRRCIIWSVEFVPLFASFGGG